MRLITPATATTKAAATTTTLCGYRGVWVRPHGVAATGQP
jgi:hypothetical protein